jgi:hypothetical protein
MLRTQGFFEGVPIGDKKVHSEIDTAVGPVSAELLAASALGLQKPYGEQTLGFSAGMVAQLKDDSGTIAVTISDGTQPEGVFADSYIDALKSGKVTYYSYFGDYFTDIFDPTPTAAYLVGQDLYVVGTTATDVLKGMITNDVTQTTKATCKKIGHVIQVPDLANGILLGFRWQINTIEKD